jgi:hypothetical protein
LITHWTVRGRRPALAVLAALITTVAALVAVSTQTARGQEPGGAEAQQASAPPTAEAAVVSRKRVEPKRRKVVRERFAPWGKPGPAKVRRIIRIESRRWGIDPARLSRRVACESNYRWWADSGAYYGLLQFAPSTFSRGVGSIRTRRVAFKRESWRKVRGRTVTEYSDGRVERERHKPQRQRVVKIYSGRLPRRPGILHAWTQVRIGAQAIRGISSVSSSEWGCPA